MLARHVSDLTGPSSGAFVYKLYVQIWYVVLLCVLLDTSSRYDVVGRTISSETCCLAGGYRSRQPDRSCRFPLNHARSTRSFWAKCWSQHVVTLVAVTLEMRKRILTLSLAKISCKRETDLKTYDLMDDLSGHTFRF